MDSIEAMARKLLGEQVTEPIDQPNVAALQRFLKTRQGREAARSAIDRLVFNANIGMPPRMPPHKEVVKTIEGIMSGTSDFQTEAAAVDPMNITAAQHAGFNQEDFTQ